MSEHARALEDALGAVRRRWRRLAGLRLLTRMALGAGAIGLAGLALTWVPGAGPAWLVAVTVATALAAAAWVAVHAVRRPSTPRDAEIARLVEEHYPDLEDRVVSAVDLQRRAADRVPALGDALLADAARAVAHVDPAHVVPGERMRAVAWRAAGASAICAVLVAGWWFPAGRAWHAAGFLLFPERFVLDVTPGDARVRPGEALTIQARTSAARGGIVPELTVRVGDEVRTVRMQPAGDPDVFSWPFDPVPGSFTYHVGAAGRTSPEFTVTLLEPPRVRQIDLRYTYPAFTKLAPRVETDGGDIYAPAGTAVQVTVHPSGPMAAGTLTLGDTKVPLVAGPDGTMLGDLRVDADGSYRVALADHDGLTSRGDTEYFIRVLNDRPPDVRILRPAGDRDVTPLEEVTIEARAEDDYGLDAFELVYSVRGGTERAVPFEGPQSAQSALSAVGRRTLHLEDLDVQPGDFVTYYARVRDVGRGRRSTEARSDIFFLEVKPFEEEFAAAQSQAMAGGGGGGGLDDLVTAQKEIIVATWKLERRSAAGRSDEDVKAIAAAQGELRSRTARAAAQGREPTRRRFRSPSPGIAAGAEEPMAQAVLAMGRAEASLNALRTKDALPSEMEALNHLLRAQAEVRRREVARQQANAGGGGGSNRSQQDLSSLFDRELRRQQETNYETPRTAEERAESSGNEALEKVRELARRQEQLAREQEDLARDREQLSAEELKRRLERLTREQMELRRQAEQLAQQMARQSGGQQQGGQQQSRASARGQQAGGTGAESDPNRLREASEEMRGAAADLRREDPDRARTRSARALDRLRATERQLQGGQPDERRRALGDLQLEARQLAERQRSIAQESGGAAAGERDQRRRLAGEQERLAERTERLEEQIRGLASSSASAGEGGGAGRAAREADEQQLSRRMHELARDLRGDEGAAPGSQACGEVARGLERLADRLSEAGGLPRGGEDHQVSDQLARAREARERLEGVQRQIEQLQRDAEAQAAERAAGAPANSRGKAGSSASQARADRQGGSEEGSPRAGEGGQGGGEPGGATAELERLQREYADQLREVARLQQEVQSSRGGTGGGGMATPEGQQMSLSAPGTEAFKQDYSRWEILHKDLTNNLQRLEASLSQQLLERALRERLQAGGADTAPEEYQRAVERYFKSLAAPKP